MNEVSKIKVIEKLFQNGRWYAILDEPIGGRNKIPYANYIWLSTNPAFEIIPRGYVIHHLDHDETNDDPSNLVLMQKHLHAAHHWKNKTITPEIRIDPKAIRPPKGQFYPSREPRVSFNKNQGRYGVRFMEAIGEDSYRRYVSEFNGDPFDTLEKAEAFKNRIWPIN